MCKAIVLNVPICKYRNDHADLKCGISSDAGNLAYSHNYSADCTIYAIDDDLHDGTMHFIDT